MTKLRKREEGQPYTPPELSRHWRCCPTKVIALIKAGQLSYFDISSATSSRPRYRIPVSSVIEFENQIGSGAELKPLKRQRRRKKDDHVIEFFK